MKLQDNTLDDLAEELDIVFNKYYKITFENNGEIKELLNPSSIIIPIVEEHKKKEYIAIIKNCTDVHIKLQSGNNDDGKLEWIPESIDCKPNNRCLACQRLMKMGKIGEDEL